MKKEFTLKNVINLMEAQGFHVREGEEIRSCTDPFPKHGKPVKYTVKAIKIEIAPKSKED